MINGATMHPFYMPHHWFASLKEANRAVWENSVRGPEGAALAFWESMRDTPFVARHPKLRREEWHKTIPLGLHGDAGSFSKQESVYLLTWNSLLGTGTTVARRFVFTVVKKSQLTEGTVDESLNLFAWSANALLTCKHPTNNWMTPPRPTMDRGGQHLADGWKGCLAQAR